MKEEEVEVDWRENVWVSGQATERATIAPRDKKQAASGVWGNQRVPAQLVSAEAQSAQTCLFADAPEAKGLILSTDCNQITPQKRLKKNVSTKAKTALGIYK